MKKSVDEYEEQVKEEAFHGCDQVEESKIAVVFRPSFHREVAYAIWDDNKYQYQGYISWFAENAWYSTKKPSDIPVGYRTPKIGSSIRNPLSATQVESKEGGIDKKEDGGIVFDGMGLSVYIKGAQVWNNNLLLIDNGSVIQAIDNIFCEILESTNDPEVCAEAAVPRMYMNSQPVRLFEKQDNDGKKVVIPTGTPFNYKGSDVTIRTEAEKAIDRMVAEADAVNLQSIRTDSWEEVDGWEKLVNGECEVV